MKVKIEGAYLNGHTYVRVVEVAEPPDGPLFADRDRWDEWWQEQISPHTGDGLTQEVEGGVHEATILSANRAALVGAYYAWMD